MAFTLRVHADVREVRRDLESVDVGLGRELGAIRRDAADLVARRATRLAPRGPGPIAGARHPDDRLPHLADTIAGKVSGVFSSHPGAIVHEHGGTIAPRGPRVQTIRIPRSAMAHRAGVQMAARVEDLMADRVDALLKTAGL
jgi:hypothetical protein